jgi:hypothetical protein
VRRAHVETHEAERRQVTLAHQAVELAFARRRVHGGGQEYQGCIHFAGDM